MFDQSGDERSLVRRAALTIAYEAMNSRVESESRSVIGMGSLQIASESIGSRKIDDFRIHCLAKKSRENTLGDPRLLSLSLGIIAFAVFCM
jgi:hypothetical protein